MHVKFASSDIDLARCFPIIVQLRPHLTQSEFTNRVKHQQQAGYSLVYLEQHDTIKSVAGFRVLETLVDGRLLYVDDLISDASERSKGYGSALLDWLVDYAKSKECSSVQLDSGVQRAEAHRFYFRKGMKISAFHFNLSINSQDQTRHYKGS
jgi:GNAT superfamily N-acetyltransferase